MHFFQKFKIIFIGLLIVLTSTASLITFSQEEGYQVFCDKLKICMVENMKAQGSYQEGLEQFIEPVLEQACQQGLNEYQIIAEKSKDDPDMQVKTKACLDSFLQTSCDVMIGAFTSGSSITPECEDAEAYAKEKGYINK